MLDEIENKGVREFVDLIEESVHHVTLNSQLRELSGIVFIISLVFLLFCHKSLDSVLKNVSDRSIFALSVGSLGRMALGLTIGIVHVTSRGGVPVIKSLRI